MHRTIRRATPNESQNPAQAQTNRIRAIDFGENIADLNADRSGRRPDQCFQDPGLTIAGFQAHADSVRLPVHELHIMLEFLLGLEMRVFQISQAVEQWRPVMFRPT